MDYSVILAVPLWVEILAFALLFMASITACAARSKFRLAQVLIPAFFAIILIGPPSYFANIGHATGNSGEELKASILVIAWIVAFALGTAAITIYGLRK